MRFDACFTPSVSAVLEANNLCIVLASASNGINLLLIEVGRTTAAVTLTCHQVIVPMLRDKECSVFVTVWVGGWVGV